MGTTKPVNIIGRTYYFYNDIIDLDKFDGALLKIDKKNYKDLDFYNIGYVTTKKNLGCGYDVNSVNPLYLNITRVYGYIEEKDECKYLVIDSADSEVFRKYNDVFDSIRNKINEIDDNKYDYGVDYNKIKFSSDDDLPLNKLLKFSIMTITIRCVIMDDDKLYRQLYLDDTLYEL